MVRLSISEFAPHLSLCYSAYSKTMKFTTANVDARKKLDIRAGDTVRVWQRIKEKVQEKDKIKEKTRTQAFEGLVLGNKHGKEAGARFTVRRVIDGVGVEKIFPLYASTIEKIEILKKSKVRRAKLYHIRKKAAKEIKREMRNIVNVKEEAPVPAADEAKVEEKVEEKKEEVVAEVK